MTIGQLRFGMLSGPSGSPPRRGQVVAGSVVAAALLLLYVPVFAHAVDVWRLDEEFSFAFLVPPFTVALLWLRRHAIRASMGPGSNLGLIPLIGGLLILLVGARSGIHAIGGGSFVVTAVGAVAYIYGLRAAGAMLFPLAFFSFSLALYRGLLVTLGFALQNLTAHSSALLASHLGAPVHRSGVDLFIGRFHLVVAEACSGMSSLLALLFLGGLIVGLAQAPIPRRFLLIVLVIPIVLTANIIRVTLVLLLVQVFGLAVAEGFIHGMFSAVLFAVAFVLFVLVGEMLGCYPRIGGTASSSPLPS